MKPLTPEQIDALRNAGLLDGPLLTPTPTIVESAQALVRRAHIMAGLMDSAARYLDARGHSRDLAADLRAEADKLRKANDTVRIALD